MQKEMKDDIKKIIFTGGHAGSTAFVVMEEIRSQMKNWDLYWIGLKTSFEGKKVPPLSSLYFPKYGIKTYEIYAGRIQRKMTLWTVPSLIKIPIGFIHAFFLLRKIKPDLILSFGGFSAFPVVVVGYLLKIPVLVHEQTSVVGRANKYSSFFARKIAISRETSFPFFPKNKVVLTGNPTPREVFSDDFKDLPDNPVILITGGQSGSTAINDAVEIILPDILKNYSVIHLTGIKEEDKFKTIRDKLNVNMKQRYEVFGIVDLKKYNRIFNSSNLVISRAGANTVSKIIASKKASILIPLPISYLSEQSKNAFFARQFGASEVIKQSDLTPELLLSKINYTFKHWDLIKNNIKNKISPDVNAAKALVNLIEDELR